VHPEPHLEVETIFFDWGGTLAGVTREADHWPLCALRACDLVVDEPGQDQQAAADLLTERFGAALSAVQADPEHREIDTRTVLAEWGALVGLGSPDAWPIDRALDAFWQSWVGVLDPIEGAAETLGELKERGYRLVLVSNVAAPARHARAELSRLGLARWLDGFVFSSVVGHRKPHPAIYEAGIASVYGPGQRAAPDRMLFVGDGPMYDVAEPQRRGMRTALVRYTGLSWPVEQLAAVRPDLRIDHIAALLDVLGPLPDRRSSSDRG